MSNNIFWIFGTLQSITLGFIIFLLFRSLNIINKAPVIGLDTQIILSIAFPLFLLIVEFVLYNNNK